MVRALLPSLPVLSAAAVLVLAGVVHGIRTDRWVLSRDLQDAVARLESVPAAVGDWEGKTLELDPRELDLSGSAGYALRRFVHVSIHTPDVCYRGLGYEPAAAPVRWTAPARGADPSATFLSARFYKAEAAGTAPLRILWAWGADGAWQAPEHPRLAFAHQPALYKMYVVRQLAREDEPLEKDPSVRFLEQFLPPLGRALFPAS
jgi:hypothetical protein